MPLFTPILRMLMLFLNVYFTFKTLKHPPATTRNGGKPSSKLVTQRKRDMKGCLAVWIVWCCFIGYERLLEPVVYLFVPFYHEFKAMAMLFLMLTRAKGAEPIYLHVIRPFLKPYTPIIDSVLDVASSLADLITSFVFIPTWFNFFSFTSTSTPIPIAYQSGYPDVSQPPVALPGTGSGSSRLLEQIPTDSRRSSPSQNPSSNGTGTGASIGVGKGRAIPSRSSSSSIARSSASASASTQAQSRRHASAQQPRPSSSRGSAMRITSTTTPTRRRVSAETYQPPDQPQPQSQSQSNGHSQQQGQGQGLSGENPNLATNATTNGSSTANDNHSLNAGRSSSRSRPSSSGKGQRERKQNLNSDGADRNGRSGRNDSKTTLASLSRGPSRRDSDGVPSGVDHRRGYSTGSVGGQQQTSQQHEIWYPPISSYDTPEGPFVPPVYVDDSGNDISATRGTSLTGDHQPVEALAQDLLNAAASSSAGSGFQGQNGTNPHLEQNTEDGHDGDDWRQYPPFPSAYPLSPELKTLPAPVDGAPAAAPYPANGYAYSMTSFSTIYAQMPESQLQAEVDEFGMLTREPPGGFTNSQQDFHESLLQGREPSLMNPGSVSSLSDSTTTLRVQDSSADLASSYSSKFAASSSMMNVIGDDDGAGDDDADSPVDDEEGDRWDLSEEEGDEDGHGDGDEYEDDEDEDDFDITLKTPPKMNISLPPDSVRTPQSARMPVFRARSTAGAHGDDDRGETGSISDIGEPDEVMNGNSRSTSGSFDVNGSAPAFAFAPNSSTTNLRSVHDPNHPSNSPNRSRPNISIIPADPIVRSSTDDEEDESLLGAPLSATSRLSTDDDGHSTLRTRSDIDVDDNDAIVDDDELETDSLSSPISPGTRTEERKPADIPTNDSESPVVGEKDIRESTEIPELEPEMGGKGTLRPKRSKAQQQSQAQTQAQNQKPTTTQSLRGRGQGPATPTTRVRATRRTPAGANGSTNGAAEAGGSGSAANASSSTEPLANATNVSVAARKTTRGTGTQTLAPAASGKKRKVVPAPAAAQARKTRSTTKAGSGGGSGSVE